MGPESVSPQPPAASDDRGDISLDWLIRLRWGAAVGPAAHDRCGRRRSSAAFPFRGSWPWWRSRSRAMRSWLSAADGSPTRARLCGGALTLDTLLLTGLLARAAGPPTRSACSTSCTSHSPRSCCGRAGPGSSRGSPWSATACSFAAGGVASAHAAHPRDDLGAHLQGMWVAFTVAARAHRLLRGASSPPPSSSARRRWPRCGNAPRATSGWRR